MGVFNCSILSASLGLVWDFSPLLCPRSFLCLLLPHLAPLLFPCARYTVWDTQFVHGIPVPCMASLFPAVPCISGTLLWIHRAQVLLLGHQNTLTTESHTFFFIPKVLSEFQNNFSIIIYLDNYSQVYPGYRPDVCSRCLFPVLVLTLQR